MSDVRRQFGKTAAAYLTSATHARGDDLLRMVEVSGARPTDLLLDVATNVGHNARAFAPRVRQVIGLDVTVEALALQRRANADAGVANVSLVIGDAEALPFPDGSFDLVTNRLAAHHHADPARAFRETARVLAEGGRFLFCDNYAPDDPALDVFINTLERLRDPSHVREHALGEWRELLEAAGLVLESEWTGFTPLEVEPWLARSQTEPGASEQARELLAHAPDEAKDTFAIGDGRFRLLKTVIVARRP